MQCEFPPPPNPLPKKKIDFPIGPVNNRIHLPDSQFTSPRLLDTISLHTVYTGHWALGFTTFFFSDVLQICAQARQPLGLVFIFITSYPMGQEKSMTHLHSLTIFSGACDLKSHISCQLALTSREQAVLASDVKIEIKSPGNCHKITVEKFLENHVNKQDFQNNK